jgi:very-short-patch-repair endonuclease
MSDVVDTSRRPRGRPKESLPTWVEDLYSKWRNERPWWELGKHDPRPVYWDLKCGCVLFKSRHAVAKALDLNPPGPRATTHDCLKCFAHSKDKKRKASKAARAAYAVLCDTAASEDTPCTVVWEAHAVKGCRAFDFWLPERGVVVEVDGRQHTDKAGRGECDVERQAELDRLKESKATAAGMHVVRLDARDMTSAWAPTMTQALRAAGCGEEARVHMT